MLLGADWGTPVMSGDDPLFETIPMDQYPNKWRFTDPRYDVLPPIHLAHIRPLTPEAAKRLWDQTDNAGLHEVTFQTDPLRVVPFAPGLFSRIESIDIYDLLGDPDGERRVRKWLYQRGIPFKRWVLLSRRPDHAIATSWKVFVKYWSAFYYPGDQFVVFDGSFHWALLFYHEEEIFFGSNPRREGRDPGRAGTHPA
jgi:hypothetical protein